jgi:hypothetical protein
MSEDTNAATDACILHGYVPQAEFAQANHVTTRTVARYRRQPDGLPYLIWGGQVWINVARGRQFLESRERRLNPRRGRG